MKKLLPRMGKRGRGTVMTALSALVLVAAFLLGIGASALKQRWNSYIDMTEEGLYTLTDAFLDEVSDITDEIFITFCADPDILLNNYDTRYTYIMAREIEKHMDNVTVVTCDVERNPTAVQKYRTTSTTKISWDDVIVSCDKRYRILTAKAFFSTDSSTEEYFAYNGEYKMASVMLSITAVHRPIVYFTVGHGEAVYDPTDPDNAENEKHRAFYQLMVDNGLEVRTLSLDTAEIPDDCVLLVMNGPTVDYAAPAGDRYLVNATPPIEKLDRYLDGHGSLMVFKDPTASLPALEEYLEEWGMAYQNGVTVKADRTGAGDDAALEAAREALFAVYPESSKEALGNSLFPDIADLTTAPRTVVVRSGFLRPLWVNNTKTFSTATSALTSPVLLSAGEAKAYNTEGAIVDDAGSYSLAQITVRVSTVDACDYYSYVFCAATTELTRNETLDNPTYANYDVLFSTVRSISRTDEYASDALGGLNMNSEMYGGKRLIPSDISSTDKDVYENGKLVFTYLGLTPTAAVWWTVLILSPAVAVLAVGAVRLVRRRHR